MKELKTLYQIIYDDLKDSEMLIDYAKELKESNKSLADSYIVDAKNRLAHSQALHKEFVSIVMEKKAKEEKEHVADCLWEETHKHYVEWYECLESCISKWK